MRHPKLKQWEDTLRNVFWEIDNALEDQYGEMYPLHPSRAHRGAVSNPKYDGLFQLEAAFSGGFGSDLGRGYIVEVRMATLSKVPRDVRKQIEDEVAKMLRERLPAAFPGRDLRVERDGNVYKIFGDLSLGSV